MVSESDALFLGIDSGTSGIRAVCVDRHGNSIAEAQTRFDDAGEARTPDAWWVGICRVLEELSHQTALKHIIAIAVDGQSGTVLLCDDEGVALSPPMFYNEAAGVDVMGELAACLPNGKEVPATLGRVAELWAADKPECFHVVHQADWLAGLLCGRFGFSDENNSLKLGYNPSAGNWTFEPSSLPFDGAALPKVFQPSTQIGTVTAAVVEQFDFPPDCRICAGTTDGMAGFIAASGLDNLGPGTAVTSLGTTLVIKTVSPTRVDVPSFGIYSHRLFDNWVAGGASNSGGGALLRHFSTAEISALSAQIDPDVPTGLEYYPLVSSGERFPINDPALVDRTKPRPENDAGFLAGLFEGVARIEKRGFDLLETYGVPYPLRVKTVGGGSQNEVWIKIRQRILGVEVTAAKQTEAAYGAALVALRGASPA